MNIFKDGTIGNLKSRFFPFNIVGTVLKNILKEYSPFDVWNGDESAIFQNQIGQYSFQQRQLSGRNLKNNKERITCMSYLSMERVLLLVISQ